MLYFPNAKINIGLYVTEKRADGFHNLRTIFYPIHLRDVLEIIPANEFSFHLIQQNFEGENICTKAYHLLKTKYPNLPNINLNLLKNIPIGAGLGGGSSDAAFTLKALNEQFLLNISDIQLQDFARQLGADCAFFIKNKPVYATQKGDFFEEIMLDLNNYQIILAMPNISINTTEAFRLITPQEPKNHLKEAIKAPIEEWKNLIFNDFEEPIFSKHPSILQLKNEMYQQGALYASMSGSGSCVYGIFPKNKTYQFTLQNTQFYYL